jgi:glycosyltransferase involved in cell wall biosynthesis
MAMIRALALVPRPVGIAPSQRFRLEQWAPHLREKHGIDVTFSPFEAEDTASVLYDRGRVLSKGGRLVRDLWKRRDALELARRHDVVIVHRNVATIGPALYERLIARNGTPIVFDFDDAIWLPVLFNRFSVNALFSWLRFPGKTAAIARMASAITVGNEWLADWARKHNRNVFVVPTTIDMAVYPAQPELEQDDPFVIGWTGTFSNFVHLEMVRPAIERLARERRVEVVVVCDRPFEPAFEGARTHFVKWRADEEAAQLRAFHVGIMPLLEEAVSYGKCGCKALQYMAAGRPVVASPVGVNADIIRHGENGMIAATQDDWYRAFVQLAESRELRRRLAAAGRETVGHGYSAEDGAAAFAKAVKHAVRVRSAA